MKRILFIILIYCGSCVLAFADIATQVDPPAVKLGETFRLTIIIDDGQTKGVPDLTVLQPDFTIMGTERSMVYTIVNGQARSVNQWSVLLRPKKAGVIAIPPIQIGQQKSSASSVEVTEGTDAADKIDGILADEVVLKTELNQDQPFINQQVIYTVKLYNSRRLLDAEYQPPRIEDALLIPLDAGRRYQVVENGRTYSVEEQQYAVFPQKSGTLHLIGPTFNALVYDTVPQRISLQGKTNNLVVKPIPNNYQGEHWLPAKQIVLDENYDKNELKLLQGSTLARTITLQATGVPAQLLPTLTFDSSKQFNVYPEKPVINNVIRQQALIGTTTVKVTYLLNQSGPITIPEIRLPWFNTSTGKEDVAILPARVLTVDGQSNSASLPSKPASNIKPSIEESGSSSTPNQEVRAGEKTNHVAWWLAIAFAIAWALTLALWGFRSKWFAKSHIHKALKILHTACTQNDPVRAQAALLRWATLQWPDENMMNLSDIARLTADTQLKKQIHILLHVLFSPDANRNWQGYDLWRTVAALRYKNKPKKDKISDLPPINPS